MKLKSSVKGSDYLHNVIANYSYEKIFQGTLGGSNLEDVVKMIIDHYKNSAGINISEYDIFRANSFSKNHVRLLFDKLGQKGVKLESLLLFLYKCERRRDFEKLLTHFLEPESVSISVHPPEKLSVNEDTELQLHCRANGFPFPYYRWLRDGKLVGEGETLRIRNIARCDGGEYICFVSNHGPSLYNAAIPSSTCHVDVQHNPCPRVISIQRYNASLGAETILKCEARGDPPLDFTWYKVSPGNKPEAVVNEDTLRIPSVSGPSSDRYRCIVVNGFGKAVSHDIAISYQVEPGPVAIPIEQPRLVISKLALFISITEECKEKDLPKTSGRKDAEKIMEVLDRYDFETVSLLDLKRDDLRKAISYFAENVPKGSFVFVYVAAHGISLGGESYIIPPDPSPILNADTCIPVVEILQTIQKSGPAVCVAVIDTCRVHREGKSGAEKPCTGGAPNQLVFYSTLDGQEAKESLAVDGGCSIFTKHFVPWMNEAADRSRILDIFQQVKTRIHRDEEIRKRGDLEQTAEIRETLTDYEFHLFDKAQSRVARVDDNFSRLVSDSSSSLLNFFDNRITGTLMTKQIHSNVLLIDVLIDGQSEKKIQVALYYVRGVGRENIHCISYTLPNTHGMLKWTFEVGHLENIKEDALILQVELTDVSESSQPDVQVVKLNRPVISKILS